MKKHEWRERTDEGELRFWRASLFGGNWTLHSRLKHEEEWNDHSPMSLEQVTALREVLFRKYQRRRCAWEEVEKLDRMIEDMEKAEAAAEPALESDVDRDDDA